MKRLSLIALLLTAFSLQSFAKDGYRIQVKFKDVKDTMLFLAHYFAKPLPTVYKSDSVRLDKNGMGTMSSTQKITGGMYGLMLEDRKTFIEIVVNNGDDFSVTVNSINDLPKSVVYKNTVENEDYQKYEQFTTGIGEKHRKLMGELAAAKNSIDSAAAKAKIEEAMKSLIAYRTDYIKANPDRMLAKIFRALDAVKAPEGTHYLQDGKTVDSMFQYRYLKAHYWDNFDLKDGRMVNTPLYDDRLTSYFERWVIQVPDSVIKDADWILEQTRGTGDMFNYTLSFLSNMGQNSHVMGMDKLYVHIVKNYYMKGDATWMTNDLLEKHIKRMTEIEPNLIGNIGYDIAMKDTSGKKDIAVSQVKAKYKLIVIWEPTCGHCMKEIPEIDSMYKAANLKAKGVKIIGICSEVNEKAWKDFIKEHQLNDWVHMYDPEHKSIYKSKYDVYSTPTIYMLDEKGIIVGKRIDHSNIASLVDMLDKQEANKKKVSNK